MHVVGTHHDETQAQSVYLMQRGMTVTVCLMVASSKPLSIDYLGLPTVPVYCPALCFLFCCCLEQWTLTKGLQDSNKYKAAYVFKASLFRRESQCWCAQDPTIMEVASPCCPWFPGILPHQAESQSGIPACSRPLFLQWQT